MELSQQYGFLEELFEGPVRATDNSSSTSSWATFPTTSTSTAVTNSGGPIEFLSNGWNFDSFDWNNNNNNTSFSSIAAMSSLLLGFSTSPTTTEPNFGCSFNDQTCPFFEGFTTVPCAEIEPSFPPQEDHPSMVEDEELSGLFPGSSGFDERLSSCKVEIEQGSNNIINSNNNSQVFSVGLSSAEKKSKSKKLEGQPSKNLMAERRRRKRLNDRLSMLRSIVPKISKMDRTSILGDTIDYMKELLERINKLQEEESEESTTNDMIPLITNLNETKPSEVLARNSPKFNVERREGDTRIDICCSAKPGLLLSTVNTLEALGLEIQQCVISCFNDFSMQASCSEDAEQRTLISPEDIKQALFRTAGYGGRCL